MHRIQSFVAVSLCAVMSVPVLAQTPEIKASPSSGFFANLTRNYRPHTVPVISFEDSPRVERLMRAGRIYLSLRDAIALALENNLDIEVSRLGPKLSDANLLFHIRPAKDEVPALAEECERILVDDAANRTL